MLHIILYLKSPLSNPLKQLLFSLLYSIFRSFSILGYFLLMVQVRVQLPSFAHRYPVSSAQFVEKPVDFPLNSLDTLIENQLTTYTRMYFWAFYSFPLVYTSVLMPAPHSFNDCSFAVSFERGSVHPPTLFFFFKVILGIWGSLDTPCEFQDGFSYFCENIIGIFIGIALN